MTSADAQLSQRLHELAEHELSRHGRYQLSTAPATTQPRPFWLEALRWLYDRWQHFWSALLSHVHVTPNAAATTGDVILALLAILFLAVAIQLLRNIALVRSKPSAAEPLETRPDAPALYAAACDAAAAGSYGRAAVLLFAAMIALLETESPGNAGSQTVRELRRRLGTRHADLAASFDAIADPFVETLYAQRAIAAAQWERARDAFSVLEGRSNA